MAERGRGQSPSAMEDLLDVENKRMADSLASKVTRLKSLALDIDKDAEEQNRYLDGMVRTWEMGSRAFCANQGIGMRCGMTKALKGEALNQHQDCWGVLYRTCPCESLQFGIVHDSAMPPMCLFLAGLRFPERDGAADGQCEALLRHGALRPGQPPPAPRRVRGAHPYLLHPLLPGVPGGDLSPSWEVSQGPE
ncbi:BET1-like protein isoform 1-T1 [Sylvia borin]